MAPRQPEPQFAWAEEDTPLTDNQRLDMRAQERTLDGAMWRTAVGSLTAGLVIFKSFSSDLYRIGLVMLGLSLCITLTGLVRKATTPLRIHEHLHYRSAGNFVAFLAVVGTATSLTVVYMLSII
ncbi:hypothetical protein IWQ60_000956 [Tieghemiomyces parasiticus]|uniref:DUF202 domain-containing protein n=1 Tax=Tieghemiomyces parasiticus TaxID=78921 RepID=A0A9W8DX20_9FUNG|nr:hypothetical protein IWQ60_000956 [Tieghemiomyces parasiticus]